MSRRSLLVTLVGLTQGVFGGLVGLGGGVIAAPLLRQAGLTVHQASATTLPSVVAAGLAGGLAFFLAGKKQKEEAIEGKSDVNKSNEVRVMPVVMTSLGGMVAAPLAARFAVGTRGPVLARLMGVFMLMSAPLVVYKERIVDVEGKGELLKDPMQQAAAFFAVGAASGVATGLFGVGGGVVKVPLLSMLLPHQVAIGTSLLTMIPPSAVALVTFSRKGLVQWPLVPFLVVGAAAGTWVATKFTLRLQERDQRFLFAGVVAPLGLLQLRG